MLERIPERMLVAVILGLRVFGQRISERPSNIQRCVLECFSAVLVRNPEAFYQKEIFAELYAMALFVMSQTKDTAVLLAAVELLGGLLPVEEVGEEGLVTVHMVKAPEIVKLIHSVEFRLPRAQFVSIMLDVSVNSVSSKLVARALGALHTFLVGCVGSADLTAEVFPGLVSALFSILRQDAKSGVVVWVQRLLCSVIVQTLGDSYSSAYISYLDSKGSSGVNGMAEAGSKRTCEWMSSSCRNVQKILKGMCVRMRYHHNAKVRAGTAHFIYQIIRNCTKTLAESIPEILDPLVACTVDIGTGSEAKALVDQLLASEIEMVIHPVLCENIRKQLWKLPELIIGSANTTTKEEAVVVLIGYMNLVKQRLQLIVDLMWESWMPKFLNCLGIDFNLIEEHGTVRIEDINSDSPDYYSEMKFVHLNSPGLVKNVVEMVGVIGRAYENLDVLVDSILGFSSVDSATERILMANMLIPGAFKDRNLSDQNHTMILSVIREYVQMEMPSYSTKYEESPYLMLEKHNTKGDVLKQTEMMNMLMMYGIADFVSIISRDFDVILPDILYPILEQLGNADSWKIQKAAATALKSIAIKFGFGPRELLVANTDLVMDRIAIQLRNLEWYPKTVVTMKAIFQVLDNGALGFLEEALAEIFQVLERISVVDSYHGASRGLELIEDGSSQNVLDSLFQVLEAVCVFMVRVSPPPLPKVIAEENKRKNEDEVALEIQEFIAEYQESQRGEERKAATLEEIGNYFLHLPKESKEDAPLPAENEEKDSLEVQYALQILQTLQHHLTSSHRSIRIACLRIAGLCADVLSHSNKYSFAVHKIWSSIPYRVKESDTAVSIEALKTTTKLIQADPDFMRKRVVKEICPWVIQKIASFSDKPDRKLFHHDRELVVSSLDLLKTLVETVRIGDELEIDILASASYWIASSDTHIKLSACSIVSGAQNKDLSWLVLHEKLQGGKLFPVCNDEKWQNQARALIQTL